MTTHTYRGPGVYILSMDDQNRNGGVINVPNSIAQSFSVSPFGDLAGYRSELFGTVPQLAHSGCLPEPTLGTQSGGGGFRMEIACPTNRPCVSG